MIVFWSSDPESTCGVLCRLRGHRAPPMGAAARHRMVHIDPYLTPPRTGSAASGSRPFRAPSAALAHAIAHVWVTEGLYDKDYVADAHDRLRPVPRLPAGRGGRRRRSRPNGRRRKPASRPRIVRALAREWGTKKTYLSCGGKGVAFGGACRSATGAQWARSMVCLMAMRGLGKPGVNFGNLQYRRAAGPAVLLPRLRGRRHLRRRRGHGGCRAELPAHAAPDQHEFGHAEDLAAAHSRRRSSTARRKATRPTRARSRGNSSASPIRPPGTPASA